MSFDLGYFQLMMGLPGCDPTVNRGRFLFTFPCKVLVGQKSLEIEYGS